jgi:hypothetical protein
MDGTGGGLYFRARGGGLAGARASEREREARALGLLVPSLSLSRPPPPWAHNDKRMHISPRETRLDLKTLLKSIDNNESYAPRSLC